MRALICLFFTLASVGSIAGGMEFSLEPKTDIELQYNEFAIKDVKLNNLSAYDIEVSILDSNTLKTIKTFTLKAKTENTFRVVNTGLLKLYNPSDEKVNLKLEFVDRDGTTKSTGKKVKIVLSNPSHKEYILKLPTGSKPKLGPGSNTGMFFHVGDEIFFMHEGKELFLVKIDNTMKSGFEVNIHKRAKAQLAKINE